MARMRTIKQALMHIKTTDPDSALTETALRRMVITGELMSVRVGVKYLLDLDAVDWYLTGGQPQTDILFSEKGQREYG